MDLMLLRLDGWILAFVFVFLRCSYVGFYMTPPHDRVGRLKGQASINIVTASMKYMTLNDMLYCPLETHLSVHNIILSKCSLYNFHLGSTEYCDT